MDYALIQSNLEIIPCNQSSRVKRYFGTTATLHPLFSGCMKLVPCATVLLKEAACVESMMEIEKEGPFVENAMMAIVDDTVLVEVEGKRECLSRC